MRKSTSPLNSLQKKKKVRFYGVVCSPLGIIKSDWELSQPRRRPAWDRWKQRGHEIVDNTWGAREPVRTMPPCVQLSLTYSLNLFRYCEPIFAFCVSCQFAITQRISDWQALWGEVAFQLFTLAWLPRTGGSWGYHLSFVPLQCKWLIICLLKQQKHILSG